MFTGIVEEAGEVISFVERDEAWRLKVSAGLVTENLHLGDSVAVNGCCLTAVAFSESHIEFDLLAESMRLTSIGSVGPGGKVNLERALLPTTRMGGHFVSGHVDGLGKIESIDSEDKDFCFRIAPQPEMLKYVVKKGCITVDGVSLTVSEVNATSFVVWLIPHTLEVTNLHMKKVGDPVNLEFDLIAKYVEKLFGPKTD